MADTMRDKKLSPKLSIIIAGVLVVLAVLTAVVWKNQMRAEDKTASQQNTSATQTSKQPSKPTPVSYDGVEGKNALELLKTKATVVTKDSAYGEYVDSINGVAGGTDGKYWAFYVNGQMAQVGAADYKTKAGDKIEWKFE